MWTQTGIIFVILCIKSKQSLRTELVRDERSSGDSELLIVYNKLATLSRIVNAIALQSSSIQKTVKIREVITELLQANTESFAIVTKNDLSKFRPELEDLETRLKSIASDYPNGKSTFDDINKIMPMLNKATNFNRFKKGIGSHVQTFLDHINDIHFKNNFIACDSTVVENAKKYYDLSDKKDIVSLYTNEDKQTVKTLKDNSDKLKMCMQNFKNYGRKVREPFDDEYETIGDILLMRQNIDKINNASELENLGNYVNTLMSMATKLESSMKQEKITTVGKMLKRGIQHLKTIAETKNGPAHSLTAGFLEVDDLIKVSADLKSDWFKKEISRGKSTEELEKSLHGFFEFGERMVKLRERWKNFQAEFSASSDELEITAKMLIVVEDRSQHIDVDALHSLNNTVSSCYANVTLEPGNRNFTNFDIEKLVFEKMNTLVHDVQNWVDKVVLTIDPDVINHFLDDLNSHTFSTKDVSEMVQEVAQLHGYKVFRNFISMFDGLEKLQKEFGDVFNTGKADNAKEEFEKVFKNLGTSNYMNFSSCLKDGKFATHSINEAMKYVAPALDTNHFEGTKKLFKQFLEMRKYLTGVEKHIKEIGQNIKPSEDNPVLKFQKSKEVSVSFSRGVSMIHEMAKAYEKKEQLLKSTKYNPVVSNIIRTNNSNDFVRTFWKNPAEKITKLLKDLTTLNEFAATVKDAEIEKMKQIFLKAKKVEGFPEVFGSVYNQLKLIQYSDGEKFGNLENAKELSDLDLDFSSHRGYFPAASLSVGNIRTYFDDIFDLVDKPRKKRTVNAFGLVFGISIAIFIVVAIIGIVGYGLTASGRERYRKLYFYYFPKPKEFAKRWRYSLFMDRVDGKNALLEGVREIHKEHVLKAVKRGVYINVYANFPPELGNTALHLATKRAYPEIVDILIRYGADRTLLNAQNKTPEQMIPSDYRENQKEKIARFEQVEKIYKKYRKKKFRLHVPDLFPNTSFHIYIDGRTDDELTNAFTDKFQAISSDGFLPTTTHCIVKTDKEGLLETDDLKILLWIFSGVIIVKDSWMTECLKNEDLINHDADFLVEKVKYKGVVYDTVTQWTTAMAKGAMPYLYGFYVAVVVPGYENIALLSNIVMMHGGVMLDKFPDKEEYNIGSRPYLHVNTSPLFVIHDGTVNLDHYKNDPDKMYTLFTEQEFIMFMLKRDVHVNPNPNPPPVAINGLID
ncbi:hypothetical protein L3Y34_001493 [Caenorhabditis briggsae]|uniref:BRCT domain-containing protein n=1 Tax=Caenorhabditis briggsae TaxID=6238 RepID=A0AAE9IPZ0_CAEBR|nr:hypothetical protein L3Y34_001493 [Caenorhabditis briggsae]